jgi:hypothetical protein
MNQPLPAKRAPRKRQKKKPSKFLRPDISGENSVMAKIKADPVKYADYLAKKKAGIRKKPGRRAGVPDGFSEKQWPYQKRKARKRTQLIMKRMAERKIFEPDNDVAEKAIETCVKILSIPGEERTRLQAAKTLLEFTQKKPVAANEVTLKRAEEFLDAIAKDENIDPGTDGGSEEA